MNKLRACNITIILVEGAWVGETAFVKGLSGAVQRSGAVEIEWLLRA